MRGPFRAVLLFLVALLSCRLHAQATPDPASDESRLTAYCQTLASGLHQAEALRNACQYALTVQKKLPDYICDETVRRYGGASRRLDVIEAQVTVIDGADSYSEVRANGKPSDIKTLKLAGIWSSGEFGALVPMLFAPDNRARFVFRKEEELNSRSALVFSFEIRQPENRSFFAWELSGRMRMPGYKGTLWVDNETHRPIRLQAKSTRVQTGADARVYVRIDTKYGDIPLADGTSFLLPVQSYLLSCREEVLDKNELLGKSEVEGKSTTCNHNELEYTNCHRFRAKAKIVGEE